MNDPCSSAEEHRQYKDTDRVMGNCRACVWQRAGSVQAHRRWYGKEEDDKNLYDAKRFNILRDFPVVDLADGLYAAPFPTYALTRAIDGFYYDLLDEVARRKSASGAGGNPYDNEMSNTLGTLFERYVGRQLKQLPASEGELRGEFEYGPKRHRRMSTDWILFRSGRRPVLFECKAREAVLDVQRYADLEQLRIEVDKAIGKACGQLVKFIQAVDACEQGLEQYHGQTEFICAVVLQAPLPFHMVREIRLVIEDVARQKDPSWPVLRHRIHFVPMSTRELETAVATELQLGIPLEDQLAPYAQYREQVNRLERWDENRMPVFPQHLEEFLQEQFGGNRRIVNPLCHEVWERFGDFCQHRIFGESIESADRELFEVTQRLAYDLWERRGRPLWDDQRDWHNAEAMIARGEVRLDGS